MELVSQVEKLYLEGGSLEAVEKALVEAKLGLAKQGQLVGFSEGGRKVAEVSMMVAARKGDRAGVARAYRLLEPHFARGNGGDRHFELVGLHLLRLLAEHDLHGFHMEVAQLDSATRAHACVSFVLDLERALQAGTYPRVLASADDCAPLETFRPMLRQLLGERIRDELAACAEVAYLDLSLEEAGRLLRLSSLDELRAMAQARGWTMSAERVHFSHKQAAPLDMGASVLVSQMLQYANELERVI